MLNKGKGLKHLSIPSSFLKLPKVDYIGEKPNQNYNFPVQGQIHSQKYLLLLEHILEHDQADWTASVSQELEGNAFTSELSELSLSQFLDFLIHTAYANSQIDWNTISQIEKLFEDELDHVSRWKLPDLDFEKDINAFYASRVPNYMTETIFNGIKEIKNNIDTSNLNNITDTILNPFFLRKLQKSNFVNLGEFYDLIANLGIVKNTGMIRYENFPEFFDELYGIWTRINRERYFEDPIKKLLFKLHTILIRLTDNPQSLKECQELLNSAIGDLNSLTASQKKSYLWLIDSVKAMVVNEVTKYNMELVTEDLLLRSIGDRFMSPENTDLRTWMYAIETSDLPVWPIVLIVRGYLSVENILHRYYAELPNADNDNLVTINNFLMSLLKSFESGYFIGEKNSKIRISFHLEFYLIETWSKTAINQVKITPAKQYQIEPLVEKQIRNSRFTDYFELSLIISQILTNEYPFEAYIEKIKEHDDEFLHLIGNENFANVFVDRFAKMFNFAQQQQINGGSYPMDKYEEMIFFLQSWLPHLLEIEDLIQDTVIIFLSFLKVVINMIEGYYTMKDRLKSAKLWNLNYNLFELNLFFLYGVPKLRNINKMLSKDHIFDDFLKMLKHFNLSEKVTTVDSRYLVLDTIYDVSTFKLNHETPSIKPEKLQEDKIMEYLELQDNLQNFLSELETDDLDVVKQKILDNPFEERNPPLTFLDHLRFNNIEGLHFPLIQPINAYASAIQFFNLDIEFPTMTLKENNIPSNNPSNS